MKNVWILNHYAQEPGGAGGTRHFHLAEHLTAYGWQATVIAASVEHQTGQQRLVPGEKRRCDYFVGVPFLWLRTPGYNGNGGGRMLNMLAYTWAVLQRDSTAELIKPDAIIGSSVHPFAAFAGALLARRFKVPFIFEVRDLWPQTLIDMGRLKKSSLTTWALRKLELWLYRQAVKTIVLLPHAWEYIVPLGIQKDRVVWIPNGVDLSLFPSPAPVMPTDTFTLMYFGSHGYANGLDNVLQAMNLLQRMQGAERIRLRLIGDGPMKPSLVEQARQLGLQNVSFEFPIPKNQIPALAAQADAFVISVLNLPGLYRYGISMNKLFDYMAAMRPVIIASDAANNPIADAHAGITASPDQPQALANAILQMVKLPAEDRKRMGNAGREYVERNHSVALLAKRLADTLESVCR